MKFRHHVEPPGKATALLATVVLACLLAIPLAAGCTGGDEEETPAATGTPAATATRAPSSEFGPGVTDTEITIGTHFPMTGLVAAIWAQIPQAQEAYFRWLNDTQGGVCGRKIVLKVGDDTGDPARALEVTRKQVEEDKVLAIMGGGGQPHEAVWDYLNDNGVPDLFISWGLEKFDDPQGHPWSVTSLPSHTMEGTFFGQYISQDLPGQKVAILYQNDTFGQEGLTGLKRGLDPQKNELVSEQPYEVTEIDIRSQLTNMQRAGAEVVVLYTSPPFTAQAIKGADRMGWHPQFVVNYTSADMVLFQFVSPKLAEGMLTFQAYKWPTWTDDPAVAQHLEILRKYGGPPPSNFTIYGQSVAEQLVETLRRACDNLTREGLMAAVESIKDWHSEMWLEGINMTITDTDHATLQTMRMARVMVKDGKGDFEYFGPFYSLELDR